MELDLEMKLYNYDATLRLLMAIPGASANFLYTFRNTASVALHRRDNESICSEEIQWHNRTVTLAMSNRPLFENS